MTAKQSQNHKGSTQADMNGTQSNTEAYQARITPTPDRLRGKAALVTGGARYRQGDRTSLCARERRWLHRRYRR
jgi:hypothetical protein